MKEKMAKAALLLGLLAGFLLAGLAVDAQESGASEYQVKAAFLYNFTKFVRWPDSAFARPNSPLTIGILGDDPFGPSLELAVQGKSIDGHPLVVKKVVSIAEMKACQVLFVCRKPARNIADFADPLKGATVLTVGDADNFTKAGGMIRFVTEDTKVRFEINDAAAVKAGLTISSKLLNVALNKGKGA